MLKSQATDRCIKKDAATVAFLDEKESLQSFYFTTVSLLPQHVALPTVLRSLVEMVSKQALRFVKLEISHRLMRNFVSVSVSRVFVNND